MCTRKNKLVMKESAVLNGSLIPPCSHGQLSQSLKLYVLPAIWKPFPRQFTCLECFLDHYLFILSYRSYLILILLCQFWVPLNYMNKYTVSGGLLIFYFMKIDDYLNLNFIYKPTKRQTYPEDIAEKWIYLSLH